MFSYVDRLGRSYRRRARPLSGRSINMHIDLLAQILAVAVDHGRLASNPAVGKRRRMKVSKPRPVHLDSAEQIAILLEAAGELDRGEAVIEVQTAMADLDPAPARPDDRPARGFRDAASRRRTRVGDRGDAVARHQPRQRAVRGRPRQDRRRDARGRHAPAAAGDPDRAQGSERADRARRPSVRHRHRHGALAAQPAPGRRRAVVARRTGSSKSAACSRCRSASPRTNCGTRSPRSWSRSARTRPT